MIERDAWSHCSRSTFRDVDRVIIVALRRIFSEGVILSIYNKLDCSLEAPRHHESAAAKGVPWLLNIRQSCAAWFDLEQPLEDWYSSFLTLKKSLTMTDEEIRLKSSIMISYWVGL